CSLCTSFFVHSHLASFPTRRSSDLHHSGYCFWRCRQHGAFCRCVCPGKSRCRIGSQRVSLWCDSHTRTKSIFKKPQHPHTTMKPDRKSTRLNSSHVKISYAVFCLTK